MKPPDETKEQLAAKTPFAKWRRRQIALASLILGWPIALIVAAGLYLSRDVPSEAEQPVAELAEATPLRPDAVGFEPREIVDHEVRQTAYVRSAPGVACSDGGRCVVCWYDRPRDGAVNRDRLMCRRIFLPDGGK